MTSTFPRERLAARVPLVIAAAAVGVAVRLALVPAPPERTVEGTARMLAAAAEGEVAPDELMWEPSAGWLDPLWGRQVLFLARREGSRDVYRARVRVTREGRPIGVVGLRNLTATALGDEGELAGRDGRVAYVTRSEAGVTGVTVLDLGGYGVADLGWWQRWTTRADQWLRYGSTSGLGRLEVAFGVAPKQVAFELREDKLVLAIGEPPLPAAVHLGDARLTDGDRRHGAFAWRVPRRVKRFTHFGMDALRALLGTDRADGIKALLFGARGKLRRLAARAAAVESSSPPPPRPKSATGWPPPPIAPVLGHPFDGEGQWRPLDVAWLPKALGTVGAAPPYLVTASLRPDPGLPFARVMLVAIDTRQLELRVEAGYDEPRPKTGPGGRGRVPKELRPRLVAAFNGAFQTRHGDYGMVVDRRVLVPPVDGAATVAAGSDGVTRLGTWTGGARLPPGILSLRQNLDPLVEGGVLDPRGRKHWGFPLEGQSLLTERSALCRTRSGYLVYGHGIELSADTLGKALVLAGCDYAVHLDMNPGHVGFAVFDGAGKRSALVASEMSMAPSRYLGASPKDFFYLLLRDPAPPTRGPLAFTPAKVEQPPPTWLPAVHVASARRQDEELKVWSFAPGRFGWQLRPGTTESEARTAAPALAAVEQGSALVAVGLGRGLRKGNQRGLVLDGTVVLPIRAELGALVTSPRGDLAIGVAPEDFVPPGDASELLLLATNSRIRAEARRLGPRRERSAGCLLPGGTLLVAVMRADNSEPLASALVECGCHDVVELDRGKQVQAFVHLAGAEPPPAAEYRDTVLYGMARAAGGTALTLASVASTPKR